MTTPLLFRGEHLLLDPAGVLLWPRLSLMAVADLHLEKGSACARGGRLVPPWDSAITLGRLAALVDRHAPQTLVSVGDSFHDGQASARLAQADAAILADLARRTRIVWVQGNHDLLPPSGIAGRFTSAFVESGLTFRHHASAGEQGEISGHFHPKARVTTRVGEIVRPCFMCDDGKIMLPSFGAYTGGLEIGSAAIARHFPAGGHAYLLGRDRLFCFEVPPLAAIRDGAPASLTACDDDGAQHRTAMRAPPRNPMAGKKLASLVPSHRST
jgi:DNA ligase-associated metallophosphoesterase